MTKLIRGVVVVAMVALLASFASNSAMADATEAQAQLAYMTAVSNFDTQSGVDMQLGSNITQITNALAWLPATAPGYLSPDMQALYNTCIAGANLNLTSATNWKTPADALLGTACGLLYTASGFGGISDWQDMLDTSNSANDACNTAATALTSGINASNQGVAAVQLAYMILMMP